MKVIPLKDVAFFEDLPTLLGCSSEYVRKLVAPPNNANGEAIRRMRFPDPFYVSPSGIRLWFVSDLETWCRTIRLKRTALRTRLGSTLLDRPSLANKVLGRS